MVIWDGCQHVKKIARERRSIIGHNPDVQVSSGLDRVINGWTDYPEMPQNLEPAKLRVQKSN